MILLVTGSRSIKNKEFVYDCLDRICQSYNSLMIIHGDADGVDTLAKEYAKDHCIPQEPFPPKYELWGYKAPLKRNDEMVGMCDKGIAIWNGTSTGTKYTIDRLRENGKLLRIFRRDEE